MPDWRGIHPAIAGPPSGGNQYCGYSQFFPSFKCVCATEKTAGRLKLTSERNYLSEDNNLGTTLCGASRTGILNINLHLLWSYSKRTVYRQLGLRHLAQRACKSALIVQCQIGRAKPWLACQVLRCSPRSGRDETGVNGLRCDAIRNLFTLRNPARTFFFVA